MSDFHYLRCTNANCEKAACTDRRVRDHENSQLQARVKELEEETQKLKDEYHAKHIVWENAEEENARFRWVLEHIFSDKLECNECRADGTKSLAAHYEDLAGDVLKY